MKLRGFACLLLAGMLCFAGACAESVELFGMRVEKNAEILDFDAAGIDVTDAKRLAEALDGMPQVKEVRMFDSTMAQKDMVPADICAKTGLQPSYFSKLKSGHTKDVTWEKALLIIGALGMTPDALAT